MSDQDKPIPDHEYDGIQELDNPLPLWWLSVFFLTITFSVFYFYHYTFNDAPTHQQQLETAMAEILKNRPSTRVLGESELESKFNLPSVFTEGKAIFMGRCAVCHREDGAGGVGPNLTDNFWLQGQGKRADIYEAIAMGVPDKGMPPWKDMLKPDELTAVAAFVYSVKGKNISGKEAQGKEYP